MKHGFWTKTKDCRSFAGPDIDSNHNVVFTICLLKSKELKRRECTRWQLDTLKEGEILENYKKRTNIKLKEIEIENLNQRWETVRRLIKIAAKVTLGKNKPFNRKGRITQEIVAKIRKRK